MSKFKAAAKTALHRGWWIFGTCPASKKPFVGTHGSKDALNDDRALLRWATDPEANPCVRLDKSGLTVLDADHGLASLEHAETWAEANGIPKTYIVQTGRDCCGFHFYFRGVRKLPDVTRNSKARRIGFELDGVSGDIKCHGHVVIEGGRHKTGAVYRGNGKEIAPLPEFIRDYRDPKDIRQTEAQKARVLKWATGEKSDVPYLLKKGDGRHEKLLSDAGRLRWMGLNEEAIYLGLKDVASRFFEDGENYNDSEIRRLAYDVALKPCERVIKSKGMVLSSPEPTTRSLVVQFLRREFPIGTCPMSIHAIVERISLEYPRLTEGTLRRAMADANFVTVGKDPVDERIVLWARKAPKG